MSLQLIATLTIILLDFCQYYLLQIAVCVDLCFIIEGHDPAVAVVYDARIYCRDRSTEQIQHRHTHLDILDSFQSLKLTSKPQRVSTAMSSLQGYYGLDSLNGTVATGGSDMAVYKTSRAQYLENDSLSRTSFSDPPLGLHRKTRSMVMNGFLPGNSELFEDILIAEVGDTEAERMNEKSVRRCQKADVDSTSRTPELLLKEDSSSGFLGLTGKGLALRPKSVSRTNLAADCDSGRLNPIPMAEPFSAVDGFSGFRKSSSTSNLQDSENGSSIWSTSMWTLKPKPDFQALSTAAITRPIFDGLPKPITGRRKAALD